MTVNRDSQLNSSLTRTELDAQVESLRSVGGIYGYVAHWVEHDNKEVEE